MGFCRRCGNIVSDGPLCKCGGSSVSGLVSGRSGSDKPSTDRWSQIYTKNGSPPKSTFSRQWDSDSSSSLSISPNGSPVRRVTALSTVGVRGSSILAAKSTPSSPLKEQSLISFTPETSEDEEEEEEVAGDITLTNIFGSLLQDSDSFNRHACTECITEFPPDSTIYPNPEDPEDQRYLCYSCFVLNGGSKGDCVSCDRPVLILKVEGKFVKHDNRYWHSDCFRCRGCYKDLSSHPEVDLLGNPCCVECFDSCATYTSKPLSASNPVKGKESDDVVDELVQRLQGITDSPGSKKGTPRRLSSAKNSPSTTPVRSARRIYSRESKPNTPQGQIPADENVVGKERRGFNKPQQLSIRALGNRDIFGPVAVNGISQSRKIASDYDKQEEIKKSSIAEPIIEEINVQKTEGDSDLKPHTIAGKFGTPTACPGCHQAVSFMERGVVAGPQNTRWHALCLVCGGKRKEKREQHEGCGKKLDSSAKTDKSGKLFCRNCLNELPRDMRSSSQGSPTRYGGAITPIHTGSIFATKGSGMSTLVQQMTGEGGRNSPTRFFNRSPSPTSPLRSSTSAGDGENMGSGITKHFTGNKIAKLTQQLTGNGLTFLTGGNPPSLPVTSRSTSPEISPLGTVSEEEDGLAVAQQQAAVSRPTQGHSRSRSQYQGSGVVNKEDIGGTIRTPSIRSISPTRATFSRRPMSLLGSRHGHHKSLDEGRGMFLVRQMTGSESPVINA